MTSPNRRESLCPMIIELSIRNRQCLVHPFHPVAGVVQEVVDGVDLDEVGEEEEEKGVQ